MKIIRNLLARKNSLFSSCLLTLILSISPLIAWSDASIKDSEITHQVESKLNSDPVVPFNAIDVKTNLGIVMLSGEVVSLLARERATRITQTVRGVRSVINQIEVRPLLLRSAKSLQDAVTKALLYDAATDSYEIKVQADENGQVTLNGIVDSWAERNLAEIVAKSVNGVVSVQNNLDINLRVDRPDNEIKPEIEKRMYWNTLVNNKLINVRVDDGKVFLSGSVGSSAEKLAAELDAWVGGVKAVDSSALQVKELMGNKELRKQKDAIPSDLEILAAVQDALLYDPRVNTFDIDVLVLKGYVTLRGIVDNIEAEKAAIRDARNTVGVVSVKSLIKVRSGEKFDDETIAESITDALQRHPFLNSHEIKVSVQNKVARLYGIVDTTFEKAEAENVAQRAIGVIGVRNSLVVREPGTIAHNPYIYDWSVYDFSWYDGIASTNKSDREIKRNIENELWWSPFIDDDDVKVSVEGGIVTLTGTVDSWTEFNAASDNAFDGGAVSVINKLTVE